MSYTIEVVRDTCCVLDTFLEKDHPLTLAEITQQTELNKNKVFRILATLQECRLVKRTTSGAYCLHVHFLDFVQSINKQLNVVEVSSPVLEGLVNDTGESAFISIIDGIEALCVAARESPQKIRLSAQIGRRLPLYAGASPVVLLAFLHPKDRNELLDKIQLRPYTSQTITDRQNLEKYLAHVREKGYVVTPEDLDEGARGVGAPIRDMTGHVIASVSVAGVANRFTEERIQNYVELVLNGASQISQALGYKDDQSKKVSIS